MTEDTPVAMKLAQELADFCRRAVPIIAVASAIWGGIWAVWGDTLIALDNLPEKLAALEPGPVPFVEFSDRARMFPDKVRAGYPVMVVYTARRNRSCDTVVEARFQRVTAAFANPLWSSERTAGIAPLTIGFELFSAVVEIPDSLAAGIYAYRPVLHCPGEADVTPPPIFFEVVG